MYPNAVALAVVIATAIVTEVSDDPVAGIGGCPHGDQGCVGDVPTFVVPLLFSLIALIASALLVNKGESGWRVGRKTVERRKGSGLLRLVRVAVMGFLLFSECGVEGAGKEVAVVKGGERRRLEVWEVGAQVDLYNKISEGGTDKMTNGDTVKVNSGTYTPGSVHTVNSVFWLTNRWGTIRCEDLRLSCILDGNNKRRVMGVGGLSSWLTLTGLVFEDGFRPDYWTESAAEDGAGLYAEDGARIELIVCSFRNNEAGSAGGGIFVKSSSSDVRLYGVEFDGNSVSDGAESGDIRENSGDVTVNSYCNVGGYESVEGSGLKTSGGVAGSLYSYTCQACAAGRHSSSSAHSCSGCAAGKYSGSAAAACSACTAGKYLVLAATSSEPSACTTCGSGTYSSFGSGFCTNCVAGKHLADEATSPDLHDSEAKCTT